MPVEKKKTAQKKPPTTSIDEDAYQRAKQRVHSLRDFYSHAASYFLVNLCLLAINLLTSPSNLWFYWVSLGWGVGLLVHGINVYGLDILWGEQWEKKKIQEFLQEEKQ